MICDLLLELVSFEVTFVHNIERQIDLEDMCMSKIIRPESLHLQVYQILKQSIMDGEKKPSERVIESKVAETFGISRGPVREAIRMLIQDGLLLYNDGFVKVYEPTTYDIIEIFECRESLESLAITLVMKNVNDKFLGALADNLEATGKAAASGESLKQLDQEFHALIIQASGNHQLMKLIDMIKAKIHFMRGSMDARFYPTLLAEHEELFDCIKRRDAEEAEKRMRLHIQKGLEILKKGVDQGKPTKGVDIPMALR